MADPRLDGFYRRYPDVNLVIRAFNHTIDIAEDGVETALITRPRPQNTPGMRWLLMWREHQFAVCSLDYLRKSKSSLREVSDLSQHVLLHDETEIASERGLDWGAGFRPLSSLKKALIYKTGGFSVKATWYYKRPSRPRRCFVAHFAGHDGH